MFLGYESGGERGGRGTLQVPVEVARAIRRKQTMAKRASAGQGEEVKTREEGREGGGDEGEDPSTATAFKVNRAVVSNRHHHLSALPSAQYSMAHLSMPYLPHTTNAMHL